MRAVVVRAFGEPPSVEEAPQPEPGPGQVLIQVHAVGVNFSDTLVIAGSYQTRPPLPFSPGKGISGLVAAVGDGVSSAMLGDRVVAFIEYGGYAEYALAPACNVYPLSETISFVEAAAIGSAAQAAHFVLVDRLAIQPGETVLVTGASGVVGLAAIELAKVFGARALAGVRSRDSAVFALASGADGIVDIARENLREGLREQVHTLTDSHGADCIVEMLGGDVFDAAVRALAWRGRLAIVGFASGRIPTLKMNYPLLKNITVTGLQWSDYRDREPHWVGRVQTEINGLLEAGKLRAHIGGKFQLEDIAAALDAVTKGGTRGKIVLVPGP